MIVHITFEVVARSSLGVLVENVEELIARSEAGHLGQYLLAPALPCCSLPCCCMLCLLTPVLLGACFGPVSWQAITPDHKTMLLLWAYAYQQLWHPYSSTSQHMGSS